MQRLSFISDIASFNSCCEICQLSKNTRSSFQLNKNRSDMPFQLIFCDIWGPHRTSTYTGAYYFLTIVDDHTRCTWVYLIRHKFEAFQLLKNFYFLIKTQFHTQIKKKIYINQGSEF